MTRTDDSRQAAIDAHREDMAALRAELAGEEPAPAPWEREGKTFEAWCLENGHDPNPPF